MQHRNDERLGNRNALEVAIITTGVNDRGIVKTIWQKQQRFVELDKVIKDSQDTWKILQQNQEFP